MHALLGGAGSNILVLCEGGGGWSCSGMRSRRGKLIRRVVGVVAVGLVGTVKVSLGGLVI